MSELEAQLRAELSRHAEHAPGGTLLAERIIAAARTQPRPLGRRGWPTWTMPLLAAGAVAAIVTGVFVGVGQIRNSARPETPGLGTHLPTAALSTPVPSPPTTASPTGTPSATTSPPTRVPGDPVGITNFAATDLSFYGTEDGWALGTADCLSGAGTCPAMVRTTDGGASWHSMIQPPGDVTRIRFATPDIGYAFGPSVLEMTTDGGQSWTTQPGGAIALETLDGNVVRLVSSHSGCPGPCGVRAEYAALGATSWTTGDLGPLDVGGVQLVRSDSDVYVLATRNWAGGGPAQSTLYASTDDGAHWAEHGEPCPQAGGEVDSHALAASPGGIVAALCVPRETADAFVAVSSDAGGTFERTAGTMPWAAAYTITGDPSTVLVAAGAQSYRSTDGGASWAPIADVSGEASFVGFESPTLGRIVTDGGRTIWTTTDAGAHWSRFTFPA